MDRPLLLIGCGDIGKRIATIAPLNGFTPVFGSSRAQEHATELAACSVIPFHLDLDDPAAPCLPPTENAAIIYLVPPPGGGFIDPRARNFCRLLDHVSPPARIVYISTTSVYGDHGDEWIDEQMPATPTTSRGKRRLDAEAAFMAWGAAHHVPVVILRVAGIYGPGRLPLQQLLNNHPVLVPEEARPTNRIHADDLAAICLAAAERGRAGALYNVCDGHPSTLTDYFTAAAALLDLPRPAQITLAEAHAVMSPLMLTYVREGSRISNRKLINELDITLHYPSLAEGLPGCRPADWQPPPEPPAMPQPVSA